MLQSSGNNNPRDQVNRHISAAGMLAPGWTYVRLGAVALAFCDV